MKVLDIGGGSSACSPTDAELQVTLHGVRTCPVPAETLL